MTASRDREDLAGFFLRMRSRESVPVKLLEAVEAVPRRLFLPGVEGDLYADQSFPLPCGETTHSAGLALRVVNALKVQPDSRILEIGTGCGYTTALLAKLGARVTTLERYRTLHKAASQRLLDLGLTNVTAILEDGREGYAEGGPYDRVLVHGAFEELPRAFLEQMASPSILVCAIGDPAGRQMLTRNHKAGSRFETESLFLVRTQPLKEGVAQAL
ncbi:methyltransferase domain-containing protein [Aureimonas mangrovi]|uniref:methyltransferase domain-containing protein n=1 Tax=Aureimonas mangrovi TaxID=2758041 RepID=UPI00163DA9B0|nr:methyltransferase domain-containing protein [Aureimonas mangrovi]